MGRQELPNCREIRREQAAVVVSIHSQSERACLTKLFPFPHIPHGLQQLLGGQGGSQATVLLLKQRHRLRPRPQRLHLATQALQVVHGTRGGMIDYQSHRPVGFGFGFELRQMVGQLLQVLVTLV